MKKHLLISILALTNILHGADEVPPFYPEPQPLAPYGSTTISKAEIQVPLTETATLAPGQFNTERSLNGTWKLSKLERSATPFADDVDLDKGYEKEGFDDSKWEDMTVPLNWYKKHPEVYADKEPYVKGTYRKKFDLTEDEIKKGRILLNFGVIGYDGTVFVNGKKVGRHKGDFTPAEFDITPYVKAGGNTLAIRVLSDFGPHRSSVPLATHVYGSQWSWGNIKAGLWQPVTLKIQPAIRFQEMLISPDLARNAVHVDFVIDNQTGKEAKVNVGFVASTALKTDPNKVVGTSESKEVVLKPGLNPGGTTIKLNDPVKWSPDNPFLYYLTGYVKNGGKMVSAKAERFGYRDFKIKDGKFYLNGERIYLFGENIPAVRFGGETDPETDRKALHDFMAGFKSLGYNMVRNSHMPILIDTLEISDEVGIMIFDEWGWSFTDKLDEKPFQENNDRELVEWLKRDYNHPSVTLWSAGNEVRHRDNPPVKRQLDRQVDIIRKFDKSGRPVSSFSGSASWSAYGTDPLNTDFLDLHNYGGLSAPSWTAYNTSINNQYDESLKHYGRQGKDIGMPYVIWECVGFSWGGKSDAKFKLNDINAYAKYARGKTSWGEPNAIGFAGTIGLEAALDPNRGLDYGKALFGKRVLELVRQNERMDGFAPWFHGYNLPAATLWNQPVFPGVRNAVGLPPVNLFSGDSYPEELYVVNSTNKSVEGAVMHVWLVTPQGDEMELGGLNVPSVKPWSMAAFPVDLKIPDVPSPYVQMRVTLTGADGKEIGRNFYNVSIRSRKMLSEPVKTSEKIALLNVGNDADVAATGAILKSLGIPFDVVPGAELSSTHTVAIIPAGIQNTGRLNVQGEAFIPWMQKGGKLLVLDQNTNTQAVMPYSRLVKAEMPYVDLAIPEHPVFKDLKQRDFDHWNNPDRGLVINASIAPFTTNALAVRGPFLGSQSVENAIMEATIGQGRVFWTQVSATPLWGVDSSASLYLRNVLEYMVGGGKPYAKVRPLEANVGASYNIPAGKEVFIDLSKQANRGFADDGKDNAWTGQGANDFRTMPVGRQTVNGVPFNIIDPAKNKGKGCLVLRGSDKPKFPARIDGIPVDKKLARLFFIHACAWSGEDAGRYRINYEDGTHYDYLLVNGKNIGDWWTPAFLTEAIPAIVGASNTVGQVGTYMAVVENPHPEKTIKTIDFLSAGADGAIDFLPTHVPVPILVAVTGELYNPDAKVIQPIGKPATWKSNSRGSVAKPEVTTVKDPTYGDVTKVAFPAVGQGGKDDLAFAFCNFNPEGFSMDKYNYLTFFIKVDKPGTLDISIPEKDWAKTMSTTIDLDSRYTDWQKVRLDLRANMNGNAFKNGLLRDELFFYNGNNKGAMFPRPPLTFYITGIQFE